MEKVRERPSGLGPDQGPTGPLHGKEATWAKAEMAGAVIKESEDELL
jgi:hypothetical protein